MDCSRWATYMTESQQLQAYRQAADALLAQRDGEGIWRGRLSSSPLATATAVFALSLVDLQKHQKFIDKGLHWLAEVQNPDGGWGDTDGADPSNLSTTLLCRSAFYGCQALGRFELTLNKADRWIGGKAGSLEPASIVNAVYAAYGNDRTFAVPILTMCALAGCLGQDGWKYVKPLPFELAILPRRLFRWLRLSVVSYALPALIAVGQVKFHFNPPSNPWSRFVRGLVRNKTLAFLRRLQPDNGGFLEAVPLTAFVTMSLAAMGKTQEETVRKGVEFLVQSVRQDGSWPIDTDLATWLTTLSVNTFGQDIPSFLNEEHRKTIQKWLLQYQFQTIHPFTGASPGGWGWTDKPGAVPDADDTAGALIALYYLNKEDPFVQSAAKKGIHWLLDIQNSDGGIPTFCKGWGKLPFDRSCPDITAHTIQAWKYWQEMFGPAMKKRIERSIQKALLYLRSVQTKEGYWLPLWFGNSFAKNQVNPIYGTSRVLLSLSGFSDVSIGAMTNPAIDWLISVQKPDGSWSADGQCESTEEETALAIQALTVAGMSKGMHQRATIEQAIKQGLCWFISRADVSDKSAPIGLYFAMLWYYEPLYKLLFRLGVFRNSLDFLRKE
jgi:squalene-hopene/tetraprenyl-beta-curcumene cyclase